MFDLIIFFFPFFYFPNICQTTSLLILTSSLTLNTLKLPFKSVLSRAHSKPCFTTSIVEKQSSRIAEFTLKSDYNLEYFFFKFRNTSFS